MLIVLLILLSLMNLDGDCKSMTNSSNAKFIHDSMNKLAGLLKKDELALLNRYHHVRAIVTFIEEELVGLSRFYITTSCGHALNSTFSHSLETLRTAKYIDATGKIQNGFLVGNWKLSGNYFACSQIKDAHFCTVSSLTLHVNSSKIPDINLSPQLCIPRACVERDIEHMVGQLIILASKYNIRLSNKTSPGSPVTTKSVFCVPKKREYKSGAICMIVICSSLLLLCLIGTIYGHYIDERSRDKSYTRVVDLQYGSKKSRSFEILLCFSVLRNATSLFNTHVPDGAITCVHGLRFLSMTWVILAHSIAYGPDQSSTNFIWWFTEMRRFSFQAVSNSHVSVDSFFFLSGLLVSYLSMRIYEKSGRIPLLGYYLHRYIRLTPSLAMAMFFCVYLLPVLGTSSRWDIMLGPDSSEALNCKKYWWTNLLYINNFYPEKWNDKCFIVLWYLANDTQFYVISPIILYLMYRFQLQGTYLVNGLLAATSILISGILLGISELSPLTANLQDPLKTLTGKAHTDYMSLVYDKPYNRITPYLVGLVVGYHLDQARKSTSEPPGTKVSLLGWMVATGVMLAVLYGPYTSKTHEWSVAENVIYGSTFRFLWACSLGWLVYACHRGRGGLLNRFLSWKAFIPLSRLTYGAYLLHVNIVTYFFVQNESAQFLSYETQIQNFISATVIAYLCSFVLAVTVEYPVLNLEKLARQK